MLNSRHPDITLTENGTTLGIDNFLGNCIYDRCTVKVGTLYLISGVLRCRIEYYCKAQARMQSFTEKGETTL